MPVYLTSRNVNADAALEAVRKMTALELKTRARSSHAFHPAVTTLYTET